MISRTHCCLRQHQLGHATVQPADTASGGEDQLPVHLALDEEEQVLARRVAATSRPSQQAGPQDLALVDQVPCELGVEQKGVPRVDQVLCPKFGATGEVVSAAVHHSGCRLCCRCWPAQQEGPNVAGAGATGEGVAAVLSVVGAAGGGVLATTNRGQDAAAHVASFIVQSLSVYWAGTERSHAQVLAGV